MSLLSNIKAKIEKERSLRKEEKEAFKIAKEKEAKVQAEIKKTEEAADQIKRIEKAKEKGKISAAAAAHRKELAKEIVRESAEKAKRGGAELLTYLSKHIEITPERSRRIPKKHKMKHKSMKTKRCKKRRY
jgi:hypothetical protein